MNIQFHSKSDRRSDCSFLVGKLFSRGREVSRVDVEIKNDDSAWITGVYTESEFRGLGYAGHLMCCLLQKYSNAYSEWRLSVQPFSGPREDVAPLTKEHLIAFYSNLGFEILDDTFVAGPPVMRLTQAKLKSHWFRHRYQPLDSDFFD